MQISGFEIDSNNINLRGSSEGEAQLTGPSAEEIQVYLAAKQTETIAKILANYNFKALPPEHEEARVKKAITQDELVRQAIKGQIEKIENLGDNKYLVTSKEMEIIVEISYKSVDYLGPAPFDISIISKREINL